MPTPDQYRQALELITDRAVEAATQLAQTADAATLAESVVPLISYYSDGTAALAADHYDELRELSATAKRFRAAPVVKLREAKIARAIDWVIPSLHGDFPDIPLGLERLAQVVQLETARPFRDTVLENRKRDPASVGWRRHAGAKECRFCRMLASQGAVYKESTARFAAHPHCKCTASPVFDGDPAPEASALQYVASQRTRTPAQRQQLRNYLATLPD